MQGQVALFLAQVFVGLGLASSKTHFSFVAIVGNLTI
jgi:hypothetical protein